MRKLMFIAIAVIGLVFTGNSFGQTPGVRKTTIKKPKVNSQSLQSDDVNADNEGTVAERRKSVKTKVQTQKATPNSLPVSGEITTKANRRRFDHIGNVKGSAEETDRNRKPKAEKFAGTIMEGSNIKRKQPRKGKGKDKH